MTTKWAIVTGASFGIGREIAKVLANKNYHLILVARSRDALQSLADELKAKVSCQIHCLDLTQESARQALYEACQKSQAEIEILVNNAGLGNYGNFHERPYREIKTMLDLNLDALVHLCHLFTPQMVKQGRGYILNVASTAAFQATPSLAVYGASKSFVLHFSLALQEELQNTGVSCTALCPGPTETRFFEVAKWQVNTVTKALTMNARAVAETGVEALLARKDVCVPGLVNLAGALSTRLLPMRLAARITHNFLK